MRSVSSSAFLAVAVTVLALSLMAATASPAPEMLGLDVKVVAGANAGKSYCLTCVAPTKPLVVTFVSSTNDMVADYTKQLDEVAAKHKSAAGTVAVVFLGQAGTDEAKLKSIAQTRGLRLVSLATLAKPEQLANWKPDKNKPTNAYIVREHKIAKHLTVGCPHCEGLASTLAKQLASTRTPAPPSGGGHRHTSNTGGAGDAGCCG